MKILQVIPNVYSAGAERFTVDLSNELARRHQVRLFLFSSPQLPGNRLLSDQLSEQVSVRHTDKKSGFDPNVFGSFRQQLRRFEPDVVHTHVGAFRYAAPLLWLGGYPSVHTVHSDAFREALDKKGLWYRKFMFRNRNLMPVTISEESTRSFLKAYPGFKYRMIYNGRACPEPSAEAETVQHEINNYKETENTRIFLFVGRLDEAKNPLMLFNAFGQLRASGADARLLLIGRQAETPYGRRVAALMRSMTGGAAADNSGIHYLGEKKNVGDYLAAADFFCLSSIYEGMPISLIEAFAAGCVPVCTPVGGIPEMVGTAGFLAQDRSEQAYLAALQAACSCEKNDYRQRQTELMQSFRAKYEIGSCAREYEELYEDLIHHR